ncbi:MAG: chemotaxis protein CheW [Proteobacteria bacterium]|nr:chemotaxis protein CheW [Pseudomonadota bacterium]
MEKKFIIFTLNEDFFAIDLKMAREIIPCNDIKPIPSMPDFIAGVVHLRGFLLPLIDIKKILQISPDKSKKKKVIIIAWQKKIFGLLIDEIEDIITIDEKQIISPPAILTSMDRNFLQGGIKINDKIIFILDFDFLLANHIKKQIKELS